MRERERERETTHVLRSLHAHLFAVGPTLNGEEILSETIWFSIHTAYPKSIIKQWNNKGLRFINDLFNPYTGELYSREDIQEIFQIRMTFLCYKRLIGKLPRTYATMQRKKSKTQTYHLE